jgi:nicotinate-nucleotide--dimethylbenzimidazole phosphoribosyltransferase
MTANQRRPGFRLPWSSEEDGLPTDGDSAANEMEQAASTTATPEAVAESGAPATAPEGQPPAPEAVAPEAVAPEAVAPQAAPEAAEVADGDAQPTEDAAPAESGDEFMRDLVTAMRHVADEARDAGLSELRARADEQVSKLEADAEERRAELRKRAEADVAGVGEWARAEAERIKLEAEQKVVARRARLDQELGADTSRTESDTNAVRDLVSEYERELAAYHAQLSEINDPAAFAAAAKRLPKPPLLTGQAAAAAPAAPAAETGEATNTASDAGASNGVSASEAPAEALAARLAELDASLPEATDAAEPATDNADVPASTEPAESTDAAETPETVEAAAQPGAPVAEEAVAGAEEPRAEQQDAAETAAPSPEPAPTPAPEPAPAASGAATAITEVVVKGLGSFGAITGFRQSLSGVDGIESVALSLGQTGEFVFRASHAPGFDVRAAIVTLEGDGAKVEDRPEGGLRVTLERAR